MDFEYIAKPGERPAPICCVGIELRSGREVRLWGDELRRPLPIGSNAVLVSYYAPAEMASYLALGWPLPTHVLDLFAEFRIFTNGRDGMSRISWCVAAGCAGVLWAVAPGPGDEDAMA